jgi:3-hydroxyisobutyrate dehydrogenase-like beta-hydroxyacid dehydrogenase
MTTRIGIVGLGEAGSAIAAGLQETGQAEVAGFDARLDVPAVRERAAGTGIHLASSLADLADSSEVVLCLTHASTALVVARAIAPHLGDGHVYSDWNSGGPQLKKDVAAVITPSGAAFVDGAVMAAVPRPRHRVPVLLSGDGAERLVTATAGLGMELEIVGGEPGQASAVKMLRSLLVKGLEALILECLVAARRFGAEEKVLGSMNGSLPMHDWSELASYLTTRTYLHGRRRAEEMGQVAATLREVGVDPIVATACERRLLWLADLELGSGTDAPEPQRYTDVITLVEEAS